MSEPIRYNLESGQAVEFEAGTPRDVQVKVLMGMNALPKGLGAYEQERYLTRLAAEP